MKILFSSLKCVIVNICRSVMTLTTAKTVDVSVILPVHNAGLFIDDCLASVLEQRFQGQLELSIYDDCSTDDTKCRLDSWISRLVCAGVSAIRSGHCDGGPKGVGFAKNQAVRQSQGKFLCYLDADDIMTTDRIQRQFEAAQVLPLNTIIGCRFERIPPNSTVRYTEWANGLNEDQLQTQVYMSHGPTVIMPTWFCSRNVFDEVGGFSEAGKGTAEDLIFFYRHLDLGGHVFKVEKQLLQYRYHPSATTFSISEETIWELRLRRLEVKVLSSWDTFTVWNAGKQGRKFYRCLKAEYRNKVVAFCDVDAKKISHGVYICETLNVEPKPSVPIIHFLDAKPPFIICVKLGLTKGKFEDNLRSLNLVEGRDFYHFN